MKILVTGSAGFVGANFIRYIMFNDKHAQVVGIDNLCDAKGMHNVYSNKSYDFYIGDITDNPILSRIFNIHKPDIVVHLARNYLDVDIYGSGDIFNTEINGMLNLLYNCKDSIPIVAITPIHDFCYSSVYEKLAHQTAIKLLEESENKYKIVSAATLFGPRQVYGRFVDLYKGLKTGEVVLSEKGNVTNDFLHIEDFCYALAGIINEDPGTAHHSVSINNDFTELEVAAMMQTITGGKIKIENTYTNKTLSKNIMNNVKSSWWSPKQSFKNRVVQAAQWYEYNKWIF